jgi:uncharacterized membrane protein
MESKAKLAGHPIHQMLIVFPLGLLAASLGFDAGYFVTNNPEFTTVAFWLIAAGIIGGLLAAVFGAIDWWAIPRKTRAKAIGLWHGLGNVVVVALFAITWWLRYSTAGYIPSGGAILASCLAVLLALITGWLGGELVDRLGVGVDDGANLNAPNSLSGKPASMQTRDQGVGLHGSSRV